VNERDNMIAFLKSFGVTEELLHSKDNKELVSLAVIRLNEVGDKIEAESDKVYIENMERRIPELKKLLAEPIEVYVKKVSQKKTPTVVKVIGFNPITKELIVYHNGKLAAIPDDDQIITIEELRDSKKAKAGKEAA
jgi:hypothetical protein